MTAETRQVPQSPPGMSFGESIRVPEAKGARLAKIGFILAVDAALAIAGVVLMTRSGGRADAAAATDGATPGSGSASAGGAGAGTVTDDVGGATGGAGATAGGGGGTTGGGGGGGGGGTTGGGRASGTGAGTGTGTSTGTGAANDDDLISSAAAAAAAAAAGKVDAGTGSMPVVDAGVTVIPAIDAAPATEVTPDAAEAMVDAAEAAISAAGLASHLSRLVVQSSGKMDRCYQNATKALPEDQPLVGEVDIGLAVMPTGAVQNVRVNRNTTGSNDLAGCVQATAAQWAFPAHAETEPVEFEHVFRFGPRNN